MENVFHILMCVNPEYCENFIDAHKEILNQDRDYGFLQGREKFVWWGKFTKEIKTNGEYRELDPFGENPDFNNAEFINKLNNQILQNEETLLYIYNPNEHQVLWSAKVKEIFFGKGKLPPKQDFSSCAYIPKYYFYKKDIKHCKSCNGNNNKCKFRFIANSYFKLTNFHNLKIKDKKNVIDKLTESILSIAIFSSHKFFKPQYF